MSNKIFLKFFVAFGLLAMLMIFLGVQYVPRTSALPSAEENTLNTAKYTGSDYIERHPSLVGKALNYAGSDWIERHPSVVVNPMYYAGSDWIERHPSNYYSNSDWFERHPGQPDQ